MNSIKQGNGNGRGYEAAWEEAAKVITARNLRGLTVRCPTCHRPGTLISKWKAKTAVKPLYVVHTNGNGHFKACLLDQDEANAARRKIRITYDDIVKTIRLGRPFVLFSGGRDSICTLEYVRRIAKSVGKELTAVHADTTAGFPEVEEYVKEVCDRLDVQLITVRPLHDYFEVAKKWGIPGFKSRWCCETLKIAPIRRFLATIDGPKVIFDGIRATESWIRAKYVPVWFHPSFRCVSVSPIFGWSDEKVDNYIASKGLPESPTAKLGTSGECWCGAYKCRNDFEELLQIHPEIFDKLVDVEKAQRGKFTFIYEKGSQIPLESLMVESGSL